jgi:hypothetical protein
MTATNGNYVFFAGGYTTGHDGGYSTHYTNVDIYNIASKTWAVTYLPKTRYFSTLVVVNGYVNFVGGTRNLVETNVVDSLLVTSGVRSSTTGTTGKIKKTTTGVAFGDSIVDTSAASSMSAAVSFVVVLSAYLL